MAKKKSNLGARKSSAVRKRKRRSDEELIRDLQDKIRQVKERAQSREMKQSPPLRAAFGALRSIDRALEAAAEESETLLRHVLADARRPLADFLETRGVRVPKANLPRGRRPRDDRGGAGDSDGGGGDDDEGDAQD